MNGEGREGVGEGEGGGGSWKEGEEGRKGEVRKRGTNKEERMEIKGGETNRERERGLRWGGGINRGRGEGKKVLIVKL